LSSNEADPSLAGIRVLRNGTVEEIIDATWTAQNSGVEWLDDNSATIGDSYEVFLSGSGDTPSGPGLSTWHTINATREWLLEASGGSESFSGTIQIREIAVPSNTDSASFDIDSTDNG
jgi:hypothetical protein